MLVRLLCVSREGETEMFNFIIIEEWKCTHEIFSSYRLARFFFSCVGPLHISFSIALSVVICFLSVSDYTLSIMSHLSPIEKCLHSAAGLGKRPTRERERLLHSAFFSFFIWQCTICIVHNLLLRILLNILSTRLQETRWETPPRDNV